MEFLIEAITHLGVPAIIAVVFAESGLLIGFLFPGDSLLFTSGFLVQQGILNINIHLFVWLLAAAAILGDNAGYWFGHKVGRGLFEKEDSKFFKKKHLVKAEKFYQKYGGFTIILARFTPIVRTFAPIVAGVSKMDYRKFILFNVVGGIGWTLGFTYAGYYLGKMLTEAGFSIGWITIIIIVLSLIPTLWPVIKEKRNREKALETLKYQFDVLASKTKRRKK